MKRLNWLLVPALLVASSVGCRTTASPERAAPDPAESTRADARSTDNAGAPFPTMPPELGEAPDVTLPDPVVRTLSNGLEVLYAKHGTLPFVHATLMVRSGRANDPDDMAGLAAFVADMLDEGAGGRDALELSDAIELLGASMSTGAGWDDSRVHLQVLRPRLAEALALMGDVAFRPDFPEDELERVRNELLTELSGARDEPTTIASNAFAALVYGEDHPYGQLQSSESARRYAWEAVAQFHAGHYRPENAVLVLAGDVDAGADHGIVEEIFGAWPAGTPNAAPPPAAPASNQRTIYLIDKPDAPQSVIRIGHVGVSRNHPDYYAIVVMNAILGESFTSRLMTNLRTIHGFAYGANSGYGMRLGPGPFQAAASVVTDKTDSSVVEFFHELERIRAEPVPEDELQRGKQYVAFGLPHDFETASQVAGRLASVQLYGLGTDYYDTYVECIMAITAEDVQRAARQHVRPEEAVVVIVGDREMVESDLARLRLGEVVVRAVEEFVK